MGCTDLNLVSVVLLYQYSTFEQTLDSLYIHVICVLTDRIKAAVNVYSWLQ